MNKRWYEVGRWIGMFDRFRSGNSDFTPHNKIHGSVKAQSYLEIDQSDKTGELNIRAIQYVDDKNGRTKTTEVWITLNAEEAQALRRMLMNKTDMLEVTDHPLDGMISYDHDKMLSEQYGSRLVELHEIRDFGGYLTHHRVFATKNK